MLKKLDSSSQKLVLYWCALMLALPLVSTLVLILVLTLGSLGLSFHLSLDLLCVQISTETVH